jgi:hypothetical protein
MLQCQEAAVCRGVLCTEPTALAIPTQKGMSFRLWSYCLTNLTWESFSHLFALRSHFVTCFGICLHCIALLCADLVPALLRPTYACPALLLQHQHPWLLPMIRCQTTLTYFSSHSAVLHLRTHSHGFSRPAAGSARPFPRTNLQ